MPEKREHVSKRSKYFSMISPFVENSTEYLLALYYNKAGNARVLIKVRRKYDTKDYSD
jgi:hypothetical protein